MKKTIDKKAKKQKAVSKKGVFWGQFIQNDSLRQEKGNPEIGQKGKRTEERRQKGLNSGKKF